MASLKSIEGVKKTDIFKVDPRALMEYPEFNLRNYDAADTLASIEHSRNSIAWGFISPALVVYVNDDDQIVIVEGRKRRRLCGRLSAFYPCLHFFLTHPYRLVSYLLMTTDTKLKPHDTTRKKLLSSAYCEIRRQGYQGASINNILNRPG